MTRDELGVALRAAGFEATGLRLVYLVSRAEVDAIMCSGPRRDGKQTFALVDERMPPTRERTRDEALAELAGRYVAGHGPAQDIDLSWWSGLTLRDARRASRRPHRTDRDHRGRSFRVAGDSVSGPRSAPVRANRPPAPELRRAAGSSIARMGGPGIAGRAWAAERS
jgi:hypothetical protein